MPRSQRSIEKSKDFKGSMKRLISNLKPWKFTMYLALILAMISAILALIAPNKLSDLTNTIKKGLSINEAKLEEISNKISANIMKINSDSSLSLEENITLISDIKIDNVVISAEDQILFINAAKNKETFINNIPKSIYNLIKPKMDMNKVKQIALIMAIVYGVSAVFNYIQSFSMTTVSNRFANNLRSRISNKINKLPLKYFDSHETGDVLSRVTNDVDSISQNLNSSLATLVTSITLFIGSIIAMFFTNWIMALTAIFSSILGFVLMFKILNRSQKYFVIQQTELGNVNGYIEEMYSGHNVVKVYNGTKLANKEFNELNDKLYDANRKSRFLSGMMHPIMGFIGNFGYVMVCIVGALLTMNDIIEFGDIVAFMIYIRMFTNPLSQIAQAMASLQTTAASSERVFEFLDEKEMSEQKDIKKRLNKSKVKGEIEFKNVKFGYDPGRLIIKNFSVKIKPGDKVAIVGPTGAGKTTMVNLLMKFYEINNGDILIDGVSTKELTRENIHELFIMVLQDTWLFEGTIGDNIRFNKEDVSEREIWSALKTVGVDHFVKTLPNGLDYVIGDNDSISQGQKQLLTIARGMIEDAPFLILDEATSNVDTRTEELVQKAMDKLTEGRTSFIIAHRLSTIKNADLILVMNEGNIVEQGNHDELIEKNGFYASLYNAQFEK